MPHQPKLTMPRRSGLSFLMVGTGTASRTASSLGPTYMRSVVGPRRLPTAAPRRSTFAVSLELAPMGLRPGFCGNLHGVVERDHGGRGGIVGNEDGGEILVAGTGPLEWTFYCVAAADGFDRKARHVSGEKDVAAALGGGVVVVVDAGGGVGSRCELVAESGGPGGCGEDFSAFVEDGGFYVQDVGVVEMESLADDEILIGVFEGDRGRGGEIAFVRCYVERGVEAVAQRFVVGPERKRVTEFLSGGGVD